MSRALPFLVLMGCAEELPADHPCDEIAFALAARTEDCTGNTTRAVALAEDFESQWECLLEDPAVEKQLAPAGVDLYDCAFAVRNLACELVEVYDADLSMWMTSSETCELLVAPR